MTFDEIRELIKLVTETGVAELELQRGEDRVRIRRSLGTVQEFVVPEAAHGVTSIPNPGVTAVTAVGSAAPAAAGPPPAPAEPDAEDNLVTVKSPIVGTFYE